MSNRPTAYERVVSAIRESGYEGSLRAWCAEVGLSEAFLSVLRERCKRNPKASIKADAARLIASSLNIEVEDLLGTMRRPVRYPSLAAAIGAARQLGFSAEAIAAASAADPGDDPGRLWWFRRIEAEEERLRSSRPSTMVRRLGG